MKVSTQNNKLALIQLGHLNTLSFNFPLQQWNLVLQISSMSSGTSLSSHLSSYFVRLMGPLILFRNLDSKFVTMGIVATIPRDIMGPRTWAEVVLNHHAQSPPWLP